MIFNKIVQILYFFFLCPRILCGAISVQPHSGLPYRTLKGFNGICPV